MLPTSLNNVEIARQAFETYNRCGVRAVAGGHWHPEVEWHVGPWALDAAEGPGGVFVAVRIRARGARNGAAAPQHFWYAIEMEEGWERRIRVYGDPVEALEAVGLPD